MSSCQSVFFFEASARPFFCRQTKLRLESRDDVPDRAGIAFGLRPGVSGIQGACLGRAGAVHVLVGSSKGPTERIVEREVAARLLYAVPRRVEEPREFRQVRRALSASLDVWSTLPR